METIIFPSGTVTFLFTDIEGSTRLLERLREKYANLLAEHHRILREVFSRWHGQEVDTQGDAFFFVFPRATQAANAAVEAQHRLADYTWPDGETVRVRMGLHTGEPWSGVEGYVGMDVHRASRIAHAGHGGQVLLSETTTALVRDELAPEVDVLDLGQYLLKDLSRPEHIYQLLMADLQAEFPPLQAETALPLLPARPGTGRLLEIRVLGGLSLLVDGRQVTGLASRKAEALVAYLACTAKAHSREALAELLWEGQAQGRALSNLRVVLTSLRKQLNEFLLIGREEVKLNPEAAIQLDASAMEQLLASDSCEQALDLFEGEFLQGFYLEEAGQFEEWRRSEESRLHLLAVEGFHRLLETYTAQGKWEEALATNQRLIQIEPLDESARRQMMLALASTRRRAAALAEYERFRQLLKDELGATPERETSLLYEQIKSGIPLAASAPTPPLKPVPPKKPAFLDEEAPERWEKTLFVARRGELEQLNAHLSSALAGAGNLVFVTGGPGRGKTAMLNEFVRIASTNYPDLICLSGSCEAFFGIGDPYLPFREMMNILAGDLERRWRAGSIARSQAQRIWKAQPDILQILLDYGPDLFEVMVNSRTTLESAHSLPETERELVARIEQAAQVKPAWYQAQEPRDLFQQFTRVLHEFAARHPLLLVLDDFQWADNASVSLLFHLGRRLADCPILIACAYRPEEAAADREGHPHPLLKVLAEFKRNFGDIWIDLSRVDEASAMEFINDYIDTEPNQLDDEFRLALYKHTNGHPLFTIELLKALQTRGFITRQGNLWTAQAALDWESLPSRIEGVIEERLERLSQELIDLLNIACIQGELFNPQVIARVQGTSELEVTHLLSQELAKRHRLVREKGEFPAGHQNLPQFQFTHMLVHRYLYNKLGLSERRMLHARVGEALEDLYGEDSPIAAAQLVHHFEKAGATNRALVYLVMAGDRARRLYAHEEAEKYYSRAIEIQQEGGMREEQARTYFKLGLVYTAAYKPLKAQEAYACAFEIWEPLRASTSLEGSRESSDTLRVALEEPRTFDPGSAEDDISAFMAAQLFEGLVRIGGDYEVLPAAARRWDVDESGTRYVFHLRAGLQWSDGTALKAGDFEYAWKRNLEKDFDSPTASLLYPIQNACEYHEGLMDDPERVGVRAINDLELEILLCDPTPYLPYLLAHPIFMPLPRRAIEKHGAEWTAAQNMVSNGPFMLSEKEAGESLVLVRNPSFSRKAGGGVQRVECRTCEAIWQALEPYGRGELDLVSLLNADPATLAKAAKSHPGEMVSIPQPSVLYLAFRSDRAPFDDPRLRKAFIRAVDRRELAREAYQESHQVATGGFVPPGMVGHSPDIGLGYDPELARGLLKQAGYAGGNNFPRITWLQPTASKDERIVPYLKRAWQRNLGLGLEPISLEWGEFYERFTRDPADLTIMGWSADYPDPDNMLRVTFHSKEGLNVPRWSNMRFDALVESARKINDHENRMELYRQADQILVAEEAVVMPLGYGSARMLVKPWIALPHISSLALPFDQVRVKN